MNRRRDFLLALAASPVALASAQSAKPPAKTMRVGIVRVGALSQMAPLHKVLVDTLRDLGWVEGRTVVYDIAHAGGDEARLAEAATALVARRPDVIYGSNGPTARAAAGATRTIPIVFSSVPEPVKVGLVKSLSQPSGNVTGVATFGGELGARRMQLLREVMPKIGRLGVLVSSSVTIADEQGLIEKAAGPAVKVTSVAMNNPAELHSAFTALLENKAEALLLTQTALFMSERKRILELAGRHRIPVIGYRSEQVEDGALMSYNSSLADHTKRAAHLIDKVLRGAKPADIPVEQPTQFELVINLRTAKALGITIPQSVLLQATRVIE